MGIPVKIKESKALTNPGFFAFYGEKRRYPGDKFEIKSMAQFSEKYMERLDVPNIPIKDEQYDPSDEVDPNRIAELDAMIDKATADPQAAGPSATKKSAQSPRTKKKVKKQ